MKINTKKQCVECKRIFDLLDEVDAEEFYYGHDCESESGYENTFKAVVDEIINFKI